MKFNNEHVKMAFELISSLKVSHDAVDVVWAAKQQMLMADEQFANPENEEVKNDG